MTYRVNMRLPFALSAAALVLLAGGCDDRQSAADKAITAQAREMHALSADSPSPSLPDVEASNLGKLGTELASHTQGGTDSEKAAAAMLVAESNLTLAEHAMNDAAGKVTNLGNVILEVDSYLGQWRTHQAVKEAAGSYDPAPQLADIAKGKGEKDTAIAAERQRKAQLEGKYNDLAAKAKAKMDAVTERETQYAKLMEQAAKVSATEGVPLVEQANGIKREADTLRMAGTKLQAQADVLAPQVKESAAIIAQLENQKKDMEATEVALAQHLSDSRKEAAVAGAAAEVAAGNIREAMKRVMTGHEEAEAAFSKATGLYGKAAQSARESSKDSPGAGKALTGDAQLATAFMHWQHSQSLRVYAALLNSLANVKPALAESGSYAEKAKEAETAAKAARDAASEALDQAKSSFEATRVQGAAKERIESLTKMLETALTVTKDDSTTVSPELAGLAGMNAPPATMAASSAGGSASAATADASTPKAALEAFFAAAKSGNAEVSMAMIQWPDAMKPMMDAAKRLDSAFKTKFGKGMAESGGGTDFMGGGGMDPGAMVAQMKALDASSFKIEESGDTAKAVSGSQTVNLRKVNGKWMIYMPELEGPQSAMMAPMIEPMTKLFNDFTAEVESGKYATAEAANEAFGQKMKGVLMQMMGNMKPPGGG